MADHSDHNEVTYTIADGNDYPAHERPMKASSSW